MAINQKDERIRKLYTKGLRSVADIARKIGYGESVLNAGIQRVREGLDRLGLFKINI